MGTTRGVFGKKAGFGHNDTLLPPACHLSHQEATQLSNTKKIHLLAALQVALLPVYAEAQGLDMCQHCLCVVHYLGPNEDLHSLQWVEGIAARTPAGIKLTTMAWGPGSASSTGYTPVG